MIRFSQKVVLVASLIAAASLLGAATQSIGVAMSDGSILINDAKTAGNATIFAGSTLQTQKGMSQVRMKDGAQFSLASESRAKIFADHVDMEKGTARFTGFSATANGLSIRADGATTASVSMLADKNIEVAALTGNVHVFNAAGINVANLAPGRALNLRPQDAGAAAPSQMAGCVSSSSGALLLTDETSKVTVQLRGGNVKAGRRVQITGTTVANATAAKPATQVINVTTAKDLGGCNAAAAGAAAGGAAAGGAAAGAAAAGAVGISTTAAVVAGVAAATAAGVGGAAAAGSFSSTSTSQQLSAGH